MNIKLYSKTGSVIEETKLPQKLEERKVSPAVLYEVIRAYRLNQREGAASTKTRGEVSGGSKKPWKQKHTGNARAGSIRSPLWRKGGIIFGPKPRDWYISIPRAQKRLAVLSSLVQKVKSGQVSMVEDFDLDNHKTKNFVEILGKLGLNQKKVLFGDSKIRKNISISSRNIPFVNYKLAKDFNAYEIAAAENILLTKSGYEELLKILENC